MGSRLKRGVSEVVFGGGVVGVDAGFEGSRVC